MTLTAYIREKIAPHHFVSYIFGDVLICSFTWSMLNWSFDIKITNILRFEKKCRFLVKSLYFGPNPIVNEVSSRFWAFRSNCEFDKVGQKVWWERHWQLKRQCIIALSSRCYRASGVIGRVDELVLCIFRTENTQSTVRTVCIVRTHRYPDVLVPLDLVWEKYIWRFYNVGSAGSQQMLQYMRIKYRWWWI